MDKQGAKAVACVSLVRLSVRLCVRIKMGKRFIAATGWVTGQILTGMGGCGFNFEMITGDGSDLVLNFGGGGGSQKMNPCRRRLHFI